jgi:hypothetical protein
MSTTETAVVADVEKVATTVVADAEKAADASPVGTAAVEAVKAVADSAEGKKIEADAEKEGTTILHRLLADVEALAAKIKAHL